MSRRKLAALAPCLLAGTLAVPVLLDGAAVAQETAPPPAVTAVRQALDDVWWTGPMLAAGATTLPPGHFLIEPYFYDVTVHGTFDRQGDHHGEPYANGFGNLTYALYGLADGVTVGVIPTAGYNTESGRPSSSALGLGDLTLTSQFLSRPG